MTQETATNHVCHAPLTPVATPRRRHLASDALRHAELRGQYITRAHRLGTLMRHFFCRSRLPIALLAYFSPSWTTFQDERGRDFSVIVDGISN